MWFHFADAPQFSCCGFAVLFIAVLRAFVVVSVVVLLVKVALTAVMVHVRLIRSCRVAFASVVMLLSVLSLSFS